MSYVSAGLNAIGWFMVVWPWMFVVWHLLHRRHSETVIWLIGAVVAAAAVLWSKLAFALMGVEL